MPVHFFKQIGKIVNALKADTFGNLREIQLACAHEPLGLADAKRGQVGDDGRAGLFVENLFQKRRADVQRFGKRVKRDLFGIVRGEVFLCALRELLVAMQLCRHDGERLGGHVLRFRAADQNEQLLDIAFDHLIAAKWRGVLLAQIDTSRIVFKVLVCQRGL